MQVNWQGNINKVLRTMTSQTESGLKKIMSIKQPQGTTAARNTQIQRKMKTISRIYRLSRIQQHYYQLQMHQNIALLHLLGL